MQENENRNAPCSIYGYELILDMFECNTALFNRKDIDLFFTDLCELIDMTRCEVHFWDDEGLPEEERQTSPHTKGTSAVCFILTSSIVIHTLDILKSVYINVFSCKKFDPNIVAEFASKRFEATSFKTNFLERMM